MSVADTVYERLGGAAVNSPWYKPGQGPHWIDACEQFLSAGETPAGDAVAIAVSGRLLQERCHRASLVAGWWAHPQVGDLRDEARSGTRLGKALVAEKLCLIHSEVSEAMEGHRKGLTDTHLPLRKSIEVELADAVIRIADLAGALGLDLGGAIAEKMAYNAVRQDHKAEARAAAGGKAY